ncbi:dihydrofolate reductase [Hydrotalea sp.]|uniref:dihydrofolate reductase n=1 Tax=Hydrotalea sp. TaxID=2881279 RepID=UPI003D13C8B5
MQNKFELTTQQSLPTITLIVAAAENNAIGKNNALLWHLPNDLRFFKNKTWAMPVLYGRKTLNALENKPLNGRWNMVLTRNADINISGITLVHSIDAAVQKALEKGYKEIMILGGSEVYAQTIGMAHKMYITRVHSVFDDADAFFPMFSSKEWQLSSEENFTIDEKHAYAYSFQCWERI